jgi:hypothetical protein
MKIHILLLCAFALSPISAFAIQYVGNGGNIVQCTTADGKTTYEVLDSFESRLLRKKPLILNEGDPKTVAEAAVSELKELSPQRMRLYLQNLASFESESELTDAMLTPLEDAKYTAIPKNCRVLQAVIQQDFATPENKRYFIQKSNWEKLESTQKAVLMLHEIVYREALSAGQTNSIGARALVGLLISGEIRKLSPSEFAQTLFNLDFNRFEAQGLAFRLFDVKNGNKIPSMPVFGSKGEILSGMLVDVGELHFPSLNPVASARGKVKPNPTQVEFWENGAPKHIQAQDELDLVGIPASVKTREIWLDRDGLLAGVQADEPFRLSFETYFLNFAPGKLAYERGFLTASYAPLHDGWFEVNGKPVYVTPEPQKQDIPTLEFLPSGRIASVFGQAPVGILYHGHSLPLVDLKLHENAVIAGGKLTQSVSFSEKDRSYHFAENEVLYFSSEGELLSSPKIGKTTVLSIKADAEARPGETFKLTFSFQGEPVARRWMMFVQFLDAGDFPVFHYDRWPPSSMEFAHEITVPTSLKPGRYRIAIGLYDPKTDGDMFKMETGPKVIAISEDRYQIGEIQIDPPLK